MGSLLLLLLLLLKTLRKPITITITSQTITITITFPLLLHLFLLLNQRHTKQADYKVIFKDLYYVHGIKLNVNVHVYSPDIPVGSADCAIYTPGIGTHSFTVSSPLGRIQHLRTLLQL